MSGRPSHAPALEVRDIAKSYGHVRALISASFRVDYGEVLALLGDNGAGKSTLVKCISGALAADRGEILLDGQPAHMASPRDARAHGVETVYQDLALAPDLDSAANFFIGRELLRSGVLGALHALDWPRMRSETVDALNRVGIELPSGSALIGDLSGGQRQAVAIMRTATWAKTLVILDEPTAALGVRQSARVLDIIRHIRERGLGVILISHNMPQVFEIADKVVVLRQGRVALDRSIGDSNPDEVVAAMLGAEVGGSEK